MRADLLFACFDLVLVSAAYIGVMVLRFDGTVPHTSWNGFYRFLVVALVVHLGSNWAWGLYGRLWRSASIREARQVVLAGGTSLVTLVAVDLTLPGPRLAPFSVVVLGATVATMLAGASRFQSRLFAFNRRSDAQPGLRIAVIGAGEAGAAIVRDMLANPDAGFVPVAVLDDDTRTQGRRLMGVPVVGAIDELPEAVSGLEVHQVVLAIPSADHSVVRRAVNASEAAGLPLRVLPGVADLVSARVSMRDVRDLRIEDLLGRQQVTTDLDAVRGVLGGRRVLITGAGGSIGSEIARQVADLKPASLVLVDHDETHLYEVAAGVAGQAVEVLADIRDAAVVERVFDRHRPDVVFHAAAHKHVPLLEDHPCEAVTTNVLGTRNVVAAARRTGVERFVFISTDKAVRPVNMMGASKRLGEQIVLAEQPDDARFCAVRFGNVLGSRGSVVPTFMRQIAAGGPVTVTDARMTRFFMSVHEAVQLVLQAAAMSNGGEVFILEMGTPVRILDLAQRMIRFSGRRAGADIEIRVTGMRPGEKLTEELCAPDEQPEPTVHPSIVRVKPDQLAPDRLTSGLRQLEAQAARQRNDAAAGLLLELAGGGWGLDLDLETVDVRAVGDDVGSESVGVDAVGVDAVGVDAVDLNGAVDERDMGLVVDLVNGEPNWTSSST
jgi:FlaA1/EpsC-like NDP-sugar epimerase